MTVLYYRDNEGNYLGASNTPIAGAIGMTIAPDNALAVFDGSVWVEPTIVPHSVDMRQARLALFNNGHLNTVQAALEELAEPTRTASLIEWEFAKTVERDNALTQAMVAILGLTEAQTDALFIQAASL